MSVMVKNKTNKNYKRSQRGRSMVEMLGVLAIIGVLSVGGVYGYGVAMKKHKANELLHQASMLATTISAQIQSKGELPQSIENFGDAKYGTFKKPEKANDEQFTMQITGMDSAVCEQVEKMAGGMVRKAECSETTLTLTYNNNLSSEAVPAEFDGNQTACESDSSRKYCEARGECIKSTEKCLVEPKLVCENGAVAKDGACVCSNGNMYGGDCNEYCEGYFSGCSSSKNCGTNEFCLVECYNGPVDDSYYKLKCTGTCESLSNYPATEVEYEGHTYIKRSGMNMWSAYNYCQAKGLPQASWDDLRVAKPGACYGELDCSCESEGCDCFDVFDDVFGDTIYTSNSTTIGMIGCYSNDIATLEEGFCPINKWTAVCKVK